MPHKMVRQPSETPRINNVDDIIPFRYAYGNQNGYVIGKGNELSYTINGNEFKINSGRVVLQGVEDDIDANGVAFTIDMVSELRYYVIYFKVNMATNATSYEILYDTIGYPDVEAGDDLTNNNSGYANLVLYQFEVINGVINNVLKKVSPIKYAKDIYVNNAINSDNAIKKVDGSYTGFILDSDEILKRDGLIISQKQLLWEGTEVTSADSDIIVTLNDTVQDGDMIEVVIKIGQSTFAYKFKVTVVDNTCATANSMVILNNMICITAVDFRVQNSSTLKVCRPNRFFSSNSWSLNYQCYLYKVYKINE